MNYKRFTGLFLGTIFMYFIIGVASWGLGIAIHPYIPIILFIASVIVFVGMILGLSAPDGSTRAPFRALVSGNIFLTLMLTALIQSNTIMSKGEFINSSIAIVIVILIFSAFIASEYDS